MGNPLGAIMTVNYQIGKRVRTCFGYAMFCIMALALASCSGGSGGSGSAGGSGYAFDFAGKKSPAELMLACDQLAAMPGDPNRASAPVADDSFAPAAAVEKCGAALAANPNAPRAMFQLGRALWLSHQDDRAYEQLKAARLAGYGAAALLLGHAYRDGRLPAGETANLQTAAVLYEEASKAGIDGADAALADAQREIARNTFDKSLFQNGDYMEVLHSGDFSKITYPLSMLYYMQGIAKGFDDNNVIFLDQACKPLLSKVGIDLLNNVEILVVAGSVFGTKDDQGNWTPEGLAKALGSGLVKDYLIDQGERDATILYNEDIRYGCKSDVTKKILGNMMLVIRNTHVQ